MKPNMYPCICGEPSHFLWTEVDDFGSGIEIGIVLGGTGDEMSIWRRIKIAWRVLKGCRWTVSETEISEADWKKLVVETDKAIKEEKAKKAK